MPPDSVIGEDAPHPAPPSRPKGVIAIAVASLCVGTHLAIAGGLLAAGAISFSWGAYWLGGLETAGPAAFWLAAIIFIVNGAGLLALKNWARRLTLLLAMAGIAVAVPGISSAVIDVQPLRIAREGVGIIARAAVLWYLFQQDVEMVFISTRH
jgi:hypothetical protein